MIWLHNHFHLRWTRYLLPLLGVIMLAQPSLAQLAPPNIAGLENSLGVTTTTFCSGSEVKVFGQNFFSPSQTINPTEWFDSLWVEIDTHGHVLPTSANLSISVSFDSVKISLPDSFLNNTVKLFLVKRTTDGSSPPNYSYYRDTIEIVIQLDVANVQYADTSYCLGDTYPLPEFPFSAANNSGFFYGTSPTIIDSFTGEFVLHSGAIGNDRMFEFRTYGDCPDIARFEFDILNPLSSSATIQNLTYLSVFAKDTLIADTSALIPLGGFFTCQDPNLIVLDDSIGLFDLDSTLPGLYRIDYTLASSCYDTASIFLNVMPLPEIIYPSSLSILCENEAPVTPIVQNGPVGGQFGADSLGLDLDSLSGKITPALSQAGTYTVYYILPAPNSDSIIVLDSLTILSLPNTYFSFQDSVCGFDSILNIDSTAQAGGLIKILDNGSIRFQDSSNVSIPVQGSLIGGQIYQVWHILSDSGYCPDSAQLPLTVREVDSTNAYYGLQPDSVVCQNQPALSPLFTNGTPGGTFSNPFGLHIDSLGIILPDSSSPGVYTVTYTPPSTCFLLDTAVKNLTIDSTRSPYFVLPPSICEATPFLVLDSISSPGGEVKVYDGTSLIWGDTLTAIPITNLIPGQTYQVWYVLDTGACQDSMMREVRVDTLIIGSIDYGLDSNNWVCENSPPLVPVFSNNYSGGTFQVSPPGLQIDSQGIILPDSNSLGVYTVTYTPPGTCSLPDTVVEDLTIRPLPNPYFSFQDSVCGSDPILDIDSTAQAGGLIKILDNGSIRFQDSANVSIPVQGSLIGGQTYQVWHIFSDPGYCPDSSQLPLTIREVHTANVHYGLQPGSVVCQDQPAMSPLFTNGTSGGTFQASPAGLQIDSLGIILPDTSSPGVYTVTYTPPGTCSLLDTAVKDLTIDSTRSPYFVLPPSVCESTQSLALDSITSPGGKVKVYANTLLVWENSVDTIPVDTLTPGQTYQVWYVLDSGACQDSMMREVRVDSLITDSIDYGLGTNNWVCDNSPPLVPVFINNYSGGAFQANPSGLHIDTFGRIYPAISAPGTYDLTYIPPGSCADTVMVLQGFQVDSIVDASFTLSDNNPCELDSEVTVITNGNTFGFLQLEDSNSNSYTYLSPQILIPGNLQVGQTYDVTHITNGSTNCPDIATSTLFIEEETNVGVEYLELDSGTTLCLGGQTIAPLFSSGAGGVFIPSQGLIMDDSLGTIPLDTNLIGTYSINYLPPGTCKDTVTVVQSFTIADIKKVSFVLNDSMVCADAPLVTLNSLIPSNTSIRVFSANSVIQTLATNTSWVNVAGILNPGLYRVEVNSASSPGANCPDTMHSYLTVLNTTIASFSYPSINYCVSEGSAIPLSNTQTPGGRYSLGSNTSVNPVVLDTTTGICSFDSNHIGTHHILYTTPGPCPKTDSTSFSVVNALSADFRYPEDNTTFCTGVDTLEPIVGDTSGVWTFTGDTALVWADSIGGIDLNLTMPGIFTIKRKVESGGCQAEAFKTITVLATDSMTAFAPLDTFVFCTDSTAKKITFSTDTVPPGRWFIDPPNSIYGDSGFVLLAGAVPGIFEVTFIPQNSCADTLRDSIVIETAPDLSLSYSGEPFCKGSRVLSPELIAMDSLGSYWTSSSTLMINSTTGLAALDGANEGNHTVYYTSSGPCNAIDSFLLSIRPLPEVQMDVKPSMEVCEGIPVAFELEENPFSLNYYFLLDQDTVHRESEWPAVDSLKDGDAVTGVIENLFGCVDSTTITMSINSKPRFRDTLTGPMVIGPEAQSIELELDQSQTEVKWKINDEQSILEDSGRIEMPDSGVAMQLPLQVAFPLGYSPVRKELVLQALAGGCEGDTDSLELIVLPKPEPIYVPEVITPGGDNKNDTWKITWENGVTSTNYRIELFDRAGNSVYTMNDLHPNWTGGNLMDGVYKWILVEKGSNRFLQKGGLTIIRN